MPAAEDLRYPIGPFTFDRPLTQRDCEERIGWTTRQVVPHLPDSHLNAYTRFTRGYFHPQHGREIPLDEGLALYAWHGDHHTAQITSLRRRMGW